MNLVKSKQRVADHGEVFTPPWMVEAMLDLVKPETERIDARFRRAAVARQAAILAYSARAVPTAPIQYPAGRELAGSESVQGFSPQLTWSHYRALMRVDNVQARDFYEREAIECGWSKVQLERQIHSFYFERIVAHRGAQGVLPAGRERLPGQPVPAAQVLKSPLVLDFSACPTRPTCTKASWSKPSSTTCKPFCRCWPLMVPT